MSMMKTSEGKEKMTLDQFHTLCSPSGFGNAPRICTRYGLSIWHPQLALYRPERLLRDVAQKLRVWGRNRCRRRLWLAEMLRRKQDPGGCGEGG